MTAATTVTADIEHEFRRRLVAGAPDACWRASYFPRNGKGYPGMKIGDDWIAMHEVACTLAHGAPQPDHQVLHSCDEPLCINPSHLRWGTAADNIADAHERGRATNVSVWERLPARCLDDALEFLANGEHPADVARMMSVGTNAIRRLKITHTLPPPTDTRLLCGTGTRKRSGRRMFTKGIDYRDAHRIKNLRHAGLTREEVAKLYGVRVQRIADIDLGHVWSHISGPAPAHLPKREPKPPREIVRGPLTPVAAHAIKVDLHNGMTVRAVAIKHGRAESTVKDIARGSSWGWLDPTGPAPTAKPERPKHTEKEGPLTLRDVREAMALMRRGVTPTHAAHVLGLRASAVRHLANRTRYAKLIEQVEQEAKLHCDQGTED